MNVLFLGQEAAELVTFLRADGNNVIATEEKITADYAKALNIELIISYGYRHILKGDILEAYKDRILNLHISYLPWNRGVSPNLWSIVEGTEKGVTIHLLDEGIDTGDILFQSKVEIIDEDTLASSYNKLKSAIETLFKQNWPGIKSLNFERTPQDLEDGNYHSKKQTNALMEQLGITGKWDTRVGDLR